MPAWVEKREEQPKDDLNAADLGDLAAILVDAIANVHQSIAIWTDYPGFEMSEGLASLWTRIAKFGIAKMKIDDLPIIIIAVSLVIAYTTMIGGYVKAKHPFAKFAKRPTEQRKENPV